MSKGRLYFVLLTTFLSFCTLYTPQPILPQLVSEFGVTDASAALLVTFTLIPLGLAPVIYGYFLQAIPARTMLRIALVALILDQWLIFFSTEFWQILFLRGVQGLILSAVFTSLMTYCASMSSPGRVRSVMGLYVAATIVGGFSSRLLSGYLASTLGWEWVFLVLGTALVVPLILTAKMQADAEINFTRLDVRAISRIIKVPEYRNAYLSLMIMFFVFAGILALTPFHVRQIDPGVSSFTISLLYLGYIVGIPVAAFSDHLTRMFGGVRNTLLIALGITMLGLGLAQISSVAMLFLMMVVLATGFFLVHSVLSGYLNDISSEHKGVVNGIYVSAYYLSGAIGSWLPFLVYEDIGWSSTMMMSLFLLGLSVIFILGLARRETGKVRVDG
jgi:YNFM family putative membrane transporter